MKRWIDIDDRSAIAAVRRLARRYGTEINLSDTRLDELAIVVTEATTNSLRYAERGRVLIDIIRTPGTRRLALLFSDAGEGIGDMDRMFQDGESSSDSAGLGLGAIKRLSDSFDVFSSADIGTTIVCTFDSVNAAPTGVIDIGGLRVCHPAERVCGDDWMLLQTRETTDIILCDGLGHGALAAEASREILATARGFDAPPGEMMEALTQAHVGSRGAVASIVRIDHANLSLAYAGLGNIATLCITKSGTRRLAVRDGRIGAAPTRGFEETMQLAQGDLVIMYSDGLKTLRDADLPPGLLHRSPLLIAGFLINRSFRGRDDASIVVARITGQVSG